METASALFWLAVVALAYGYAGFPLLVAVVGRLRAHPVRKAEVTPSVSLVIAAYNEAGGIERRIRNALATDYPYVALEVLVASDGSTDATVEIARAFDAPRVRVLDLPRRGKVAALNEAVRHARGDVLVFSDANTVLEPDAIRKLVRNLADATVGGVAGHTTYVVETNAGAADKGEDLYWRYDTWLKVMESRTGSVVSAHGGLYAIRRELFRSLPDGAVTDDFAISAGVVAQGRRLVFEPEAHGYETTMTDSGREFRRRVRLMTRGLRSVLLRRGLLNPFRHGFYAVALFSHKILRRLLALALPVLFASSVALAGSHALYASIAAAQCLFYALAAAGWALRDTRAGGVALLYVPFYFCLANLASALALANVLAGRRIALWSPQRHEGDAHRTAAAGRHL